MLKRSAVLLVVLVIAGGAWAQQAIAQEANPAPGASVGQAGGRDQGQWQQRIEQFRQQMADRMKQALGATDEEWKVLQPRIEKVQTLSRQTRGGGMGMMFSNGRRGGPGGGPGGDKREGDKREGDKRDANRPDDRPQSEVEKKVEALQKVLDNKDAKPEEIKASLSALRGARAKARAEHEAAQKELREVVTVRQEAQLVSMGILE
jgi:Spy/CpxP family protein refolding chaperone